MSWNGLSGTCTRAYDDYKLVERDQRVFLRRGLHVARADYAHWWKLAGEAITPRDQDEVFDSMVQGLMPDDYEWMFLAAVLRDAVSAFEVYLEEALAEVASAHGYTLEKLVKWGDLTRAYKTLGVKVETGSLRRVRDLRHLLTHQRGALRDTNARKKWANEHDDDTFGPYKVELSEDDVEAHMATLRAAAAKADAVAWEYAWRGKPLPQALLEDAPEPPSWWPQQP